MAKDKGAVGSDPHVDRAAIRIIVGAALIAAGVISQTVLVKLGHPGAVWMWCQMAALCG